MSEKATTTCLTVPAASTERLSDGADEHPRPIGAVDDDVVDRDARLLPQHPRERQPIVRIPLPVARVDAVEGRTRAAQRLRARRHSHDLLERVVRVDEGAVRHAGDIDADRELVRDGYDEIVVQCACVDKVPLGPTSPSYALLRQRKRSNSLGSLPRVWCTSRRGMRRYAARKPARHVCCATRSPCVERGCFNQATLVRSTSNGPRLAAPAAWATSPPYRVEDQNG